MRRKFFYTLILLSCFCNCYAQKLHKAIFVIVDGVPADLMETIHLPTIKEIQKQGAYLHSYVGGEKGAYSQSPTISAVGYNSLLTGTWAHKHNVWGNSGKNIDSINYHYPSIFKLFKEQFPQKKSALFSTWTDNRTKLIGNQVALDIVYDGFEKDTLRFPHDKNSYYIHAIDNEVATQAAYSIRTEAPDLSWVYLQFTDDVAHRYGYSDSLTEAVKLMEKQINKIWEAVKYRQKNYNEKWQVWITTDHGRDKTGKHHGGQSVQERSTWIVSNQNLPIYFLQNGTAIVDILPTIAAFLKIQIPVNVQRELDGQSLLKKPSLNTVNMKHSNASLNISWKALQKKGKVKIWVTTTNQFKLGGNDEYRLMANVDLKKENATVDLSTMPSSFYKVVIEAPGTSLNRQIILKND
ncbi:MAG TPA: alkaline phosphatase family protein [Ferruginibacter sp.]|nr:alkaline phosphatase family protein [Ferruginibacter sp.]HRE62626.1 alkaline phosphatase family protein [Ferruginibacter sp.]